MATAPEEELDADQIQNIINLSMASAYDTVSSWLQPSSETKEDEARRLAATREEFERLAFRPPRLGVGAIAPTTAVSKDNHKLRHTLVGTKRRQDAAEDSKGKSKVVSSDDDDEDSKAQSVSVKKPRLDGASTTASSLLSFEPSSTSNKKKRRKKKKRPPEVETPADPASQDDDDGDEWTGVVSPSMGPPPDPPSDRESSSAGSPLRVVRGMPPTFTIGEPHLSRLNPLGPTVSAMNPTPTSTVSPPSSIASSQTTRVDNGKLKDKKYSPRKQKHGHDMV